MWKSEQFGLTFLRGLNVLALDQTHEDRGKTFSTQGAFFQLFFCTAASASVFNFFVSMRSFWIKSQSREYHLYVLGRSFNALVPCVFAHLLLGINCYIQRANQPPFKQLI